MKLEEYLETVSEQIRYTKIRSSVTEELKDHILDQAEAYEEMGAFPEEALERAVREMGDPVETGVALDRIHRPQMNLGIVALIAIISLLSVGVMYFAGNVSNDVPPWQNHALYTLIGFILMLLVYRLDYSILGKYPQAPIFFYCGIYFLMIYFGKSLNGTLRWIKVGPFNLSISELMLLYVPLFGSFLYSLRGNGYKIFYKVIPMIFLPCLLVMLLPDLSGSAILFTSLFFMFVFAVWKGWYQINKKLVCGISAGMLVTAPFAFVGYFLLFGAEYQQARLRAFFTNPDEFTYIARYAKAMREGSTLIGSAEQSVQLLQDGPTMEYMTDYILVSMCSIYGTLLTVAILAAMVLLVVKIFRISTTQKNQLGMIVGVGCGLVFFVKGTLSVLLNFGLIPYVSISMPFLSYGGSSIVVSYILLGLVLSIYRYKNILPAAGKVSPVSIT